MFSGACSMQPGTVFDDLTRRFPMLTVSLEAQAGVCVERRIRRTAIAGVDVEL